MVKENIILPSPLHAPHPHVVSTLGIHATYHLLHLRTGKGHCHAAVPWGSGADNLCTLEQQE